MSERQVLNKKNLGIQGRNIGYRAAAGEFILSLDDDIRKHIPEIPDFGKTITIRHLIHHTSGIRDWPGKFNGQLECLQHPSHRKYFWQKRPDV